MMAAEIAAPATGRAFSKAQKKASRKRLRQIAQDKRARERPDGPTPETARHVAANPDPWRVLLGMPEPGYDRDGAARAGGRPVRKLIDMQAEQAGDEIRAVYMAVCRSVIRTARMADSAGGGGMPDIPDALARAHALRYLPWVQRVGPRVADAVISVVVDRHWSGRATPGEVADALTDYAHHMRHRA